MGDFKIRCVKTEAGNKDTQGLIQKAFKCLTEEKFSPTWFTEEECMKVEQKEKNCIFVIDFFEGGSFDHITNLGYRVLGPQCILMSVAYKKEIPRHRTPVYNLAMKDITVCCTNISLQEREELYKFVRWMGGVVSKDLTEEVTHLIAGEVGSKKYQVAASMGKHIMLPLWVAKVWGLSILEPVHGLDEQFQEWKCPIFLGLVVTVSNLPVDQKKEAQKLIEKEGGRYTGEMKMKECTHLIINEAKGQKYEFAMKWMIHVVSTDWLYESVEKGFCQDEEKYKVTRDSSASSKAQMKTSTPERRSIAGSGMGDISNISAISMMAVNETAMNATHMTNATNLTRSSDQDHLESLDITKAPTDLFLDGCKIYLSGFRGPNLDKLRKIINAGGGTRFGQIKENLTHVIVGEKLDRDLEEIKSLASRPQVVTARWLVDCFQQGQLVREAEYSCLELPPLDPVSPSLKRKSLPARKQVEKKPAAPPSRTQEEDMKVEDDMEEIMSQYMTRPDGDTTTPPTVLEAPEEKAEEEDNDLTQAPEESQPAEDGPIFKGKKFVIYGFEEENVLILSTFIMESGGKVVQQNARAVPDFAIVPIDGFPVDRTVNDIVTNIWLQMCIEQEQILDIDRNPLYRPVEMKVEGRPLEDCVLSVSGYTGAERECLMLIADILGAKCQEYFVKKAKNNLLPSTHLILQAAEGSKYEAAKKWGIPALSKNWLLQCAKHGKRQPEENYLIGKPQGVNLSVDSNTGKQTSAEPPDKPSDIGNIPTAQAADIPVDNKYSDINSKKTDLDANTSAQVKCSATMDSSLTSRAQKSFTTEKTENEFTTGDDTDALMMQVESQECAPDAVCDKNSEKAEHSVSVFATRSRNKESTSNGANTTERIDSDGAKSSDEKTSHHTDVVVKDKIDDQQVKDSSVVQRNQTSIGKTHPTTPTLPTAVSLSQKENMTALRGKATPLQSRVKELQQQGTRKICDKDTPSRFLNPHQRYQPKFDVQELLDELQTPEEIRKKRRRSSLPLDELFEMKVEEAMQHTMQAKDAESGKSHSRVLEGVVICVSKKLATSQSELNEIVSSLGGDYRWNYDSSCTHFIFQGRQNDKTKEYRQAVQEKKQIVSPHWVYMCMEQNAQVDEELFPHTFKPHHSLTGLSVSRRGTPARTPARSTRRMAREETPMAETDNSKVRGTKKLETTLEQQTTPVRAVQEKADEVEGPDEAVETGGSLEMREMLSRQLENIMAEGKKRRTSNKRMNSSGQVKTPDDSGTGRDDSSRSSSRLSRRAQEDKARSTPTAAAQSKGTGGESHTADLVPSQSVQVVWDDPLGRMEQEKLAHKLKRASSPTQDMGSLGIEFAGDAQFSESEEEGDESNQNLPELPFTDVTAAEQKMDTTPKADKKDLLKTPTPEGPSLAFPVPSSSKNPTPPRPVELIQEDKPEKPQEPPVFLLSGMSPEERDDYGALIEQLGGKIIDTQTSDPSCTHLVIKKVTRNEKFLASVASGKWVLHVSYLEECRKEQQFVEEGIHEWGSESGGLLDDMTPHIVQLAEAARRWRIQIQEEKQKKPGEKCGAFHTWRVILCCSKAREGNYQRLLEAGGATVLNVRPPFNKPVDATHVLMELNKVSLSQEDLETLVSSGCLCLRADFISAHLADPSPNVVDFCPPEIIAIQTSLEKSAEGGKKRKGSTNQSLSKRSRRR